MDLKELKRLAATCRAAGIKHFKSEEYEFTLNEELPVSRYKKSKQAESISQVDAAFESDTLPEDALLFWSAGLEQPQGE